MIVELADVKKYYCCVDVSKQCIGEHCMAWVPLVVSKPILPTPDTRLEPPKYVNVPTTKGSCGLVKHQLV